MRQPPFRHALRGALCAGGAFLVLGGLLPGEAQACQCSGVIQQAHQETRAKIEAAKEAVNEHTSYVGDVIAQTIAQAAREIMQSVTANQKMQTTAQSKMADAEQQLEQERQKQKVMEEASKRYTPSADGCYADTGIAGLAAAEVVSDDVLKILTKVGSDRTTGQGAAGAASGENQISAAAELANILDNQKPDSVTDVHTAWQDLQGQLSLDDKELKYGKSVVDQIIEPIPRPLKDTPSETEQVKWRQYSTGMNIAREPFNQDLAERTQSVKLGDWAKELAKKAGVDLSKRPGGAPEYVSEREIMTWLVKGRWGNAEFFTKSVNQMSPEQVVREQAEMQAMMLRLIMRLDEKLQTNNEILGLLLADVVQTR